MEVAPPLHRLPTARIAIPHEPTTVILHCATSSQSKYTDTHNAKICSQQQYIVQQAVTLVSPSPALLVVRSLGHWLPLLLLQPLLQEASAAPLHEGWVLLQEVAGPLGHI